MNQQRARRFRAAMESADKKKEMDARRELLTQAGKKLPPQKAAAFDSNVITPGTEFMERLAQYVN